LRSALGSGLSGGGGQDLQDPLSFRGAAASSAPRGAAGLRRGPGRVELNASQENPMTVLAEDRIISAASTRACRSRRRST
jgi:hypothetical protein